MNEYNENPESEKFKEIDKNGVQSQDGSKLDSFEPVYDTDILEESKLNGFKPDPQLKYENVNEFNPSFHCWPDQQTKEIERQKELERLVEQIRNGDTIMDGGDLVNQARRIVELEKLVEQIRNGATIMDGGDLVEQARRIVERERKEKEIINIERNTKVGGQNTRDTSNSAISSENSKNLENQNKETVEKSNNAEKEIHKQKISKDIPDVYSKESDSKRILEKIANVKSRVFIDKDNLGSLLKTLKNDKQLNYRNISDKIGYDITLVYNRGYSIPLESFEKLQNLANSVNKNLNYERLIQKNVYDIESMQKLASIVGNTKTGKPGNCLSDTYNGMNKPLQWECGECGRVWETTPNGILYQQNWCARCSGREKWSFDQMVALAKERGLEKTGVEGKFLATKESYENQNYPDRSKYTWKCGKCETEFEASANNVKHGSWCRVCQYTKLSNDFRELHEDIQNLAKETGKTKTGYPGEFLADKDHYNSVDMPSHHKFTWRCGKCESEFQMDITHVKRPQWCPTCTEGESERICRGYFERIFDDSFPKVRPDWLINPETGKNLELDGYNENLKIAFEFNGPQHYNLYPKYHRDYDDFVKQQKLDYIREITCRQNDVTLISVPYTLDYDDFQNFIKNEYKRLTDMDLGDIPDYDWRDFATENRKISDFFD